jgi:hypothetical protein
MSNYPQTTTRGIRGNYGRRSSEFKGEGYGQGPHCPKLDCCDQLLSQLGVPDPAQSNFYDVLTELIQNAIDNESPPTPSSPLAYPARTMFVSSAWINAADLNSNQFTTIQAAIDAASALLPTAANPAAVVIYAGTYADPVTLAPNVDLYGLGGVVISGPVTYDSVSGNEEGVVVRDVEITGAVTINTIAPVPADEPLPATIVFRDVDLNVPTLTINLAASDADSVYFDGGIQRIGTLTGTAGIAGANGNYATIRFSDSQVYIARDSSITGTGPAPPPFAVGSSKRSLPSRQRAVRRGLKTVAKQVVIPGTPSNSVFFEVNNVTQFQQTGTLTLNRTNALFKDTFLTAGGVDAGTGVIATANYSVLNADKITIYNPFDDAGAPVIAMQLRIGSGLRAAVMNSNYADGSLVGVDPLAAADRNIESGTAAYAIGDTTVVLDFSDMPYITVPVITWTTDAVGTLTATPPYVVPTPPVPGSPYTAFTVTISSAAATGAGTINWVATQQVAPLEYL